MKGWLIIQFYHFCPMKGLKDSHYGWKLSTQPLPFMFGWCWTDTWKWIRLGGVGQCGVLCTALAAKGVDLTGSGLSSRPWEKPQISRARIWCPAFPPRSRSVLKICTLLKRCSEQGEQPTLRKATNLKSRARISCPGSESYLVSLLDPMIYISLSSRQENKELK